MRNPYSLNPVLVAFLALPLGCSAPGEIGLLPDEDMGGPEVVDEGEREVTPIGSPWRFEHPLPQGNDLLAVAVAQDGSAVAVGALGTVLRLNDAAITEEPRATLFTLRALALSERALWVAGDGGTVLRRTAGRWVRYQVGDTDLHTIIAHGERVHAAGRGDLLFTKEPGKPWRGRRLEGQPPELTLRAAALSGEDLYLVGDRGRILHLSGERVSVEGSGLTTVDLECALKGPDGAVYAAGQGGVILRRDPDGAWSVDARPAPDGTPTRATLRALFHTGDAVHALAVDGTLLRRGERGWEVSAVLSPPARTLAAGCSHAGCFSVGEGGLVLRRGAAPGAPFDRHPAAARVVRSGLTAVTGCEGGVAYATTEDGKILARRPTEKGASWTVAHDTSASGQPLQAIHCEGDRVFAVGMNGVIFSRGPAGWQRETFPWEGRLPNLKGVWVRGDDVYAVGSASTQQLDELAVVLHLSAGTWTSERVIPVATESLYAVTGDGSQVIAVGARGLIVRRSGAIWVREATGLYTDVQLHAIAAERGVFHAVGTQGTVLRRVFTMGGPAWLRLDLALSRPQASLSGVVVSGAKVWVVGAVGLLLRGEDMGFAVEQSPSEMRLSGVARSGDLLLAVGSRSVILKRNLE